LQAKRATREENEMYALARHEIWRQRLEEIGLEVSAIRLERSARFNRKVESLLGRNLEWELARYASASTSAPTDSVSSNQISNRDGSGPMMKVTQNRIAASKILAVGVLLVVLMAAMLLMTERHAYASTTFTVNQISDVQDEKLDDGICDINSFVSGDQCTLRAAIQQANAISGVDTIEFDLFGSGPFTIAPTSALPTITDQVTINGYSQSGASPNTLARGTNANPLIELDGTKAGAADGLVIDDGGSGSVLRGLVINRFSNQGIFIPSHAATSVRIEGNFVGTDQSGMVALPNRGDGIDLGASNSVVGGSKPAKRNLISGNGVDGLSLTSASNVRVESNLIGTKANGVGALGNGFNGVDVDDGTGDKIMSNSIFSNGELGIDLGSDGHRTPNDPGDADTGENDLQNFPVLSSARNASGKTTIKGSLNSRPGATYTIQFFSNPSGTNEGRTFIGQKTTLTLDGTGKGSFTFSPASKVAAGQTITATATNEFTGDTSEFSAPREVVSS
jgi:hypothetical protein